MATPTNVTFTTPLGSFVVGLFVDDAPRSSANFLSYATNLTSGYNVQNSFFHRLAQNFVLQGGGFGLNGNSIQTVPSQAPVQNEISASRPNVAGTIAFATFANDPNSGTNQFFFNLKDNSSDLNAGFSVFGAITSGLDVLNALAGLQVVNASSLDSAFGTLPVERFVNNSLTPADLVDFRVTVTQAINDQAVLNPFAPVTLSDAAATETVTIGYVGAHGTLSGGGFTGSPGSYAFTGSPAQIQAALRAAVFTPTANEVAPGQAVTTSFSLGIANGAATRTDTTFAVTSTSVNDAPVIGGAQAGQAATVGTGLRPFTGVTVVDPDVGQTQLITVSFAAGAGTLSGGGFAGGGGTYTLTAASAADAQAALRAAVFTPSAAGTTAFNLVVADGFANTVSAGTTVVASGGVTPPPANAPSNTSGFNGAQAPNLIRALPGGADALNPANPIFAQYQAQRAIAARLDAGQISQAQAELQLVHLVDGTTSVAVASYAFFTGRTPSLAGLNFLVHSDANPTDLNDPYYTRFTTENRYINFAANLGVFGAGRAGFQAEYGALDLRGTTAKAYQAVFGVAADAAKVSDLLDTQVPNGLGGSFTRAEYLAQFGGDGINGQGTKAALVGFLLSNAVVTGAGVYGAADVHYVQALAHGAVPAADVPLIPAYTPEVNLVGTPSTLDPSVTG